MEEMLNSMARVEMAEQIAAVVMPLERAVRQIRVKVVEEGAQLPSSHHTPAA